VASRVKEGVWLQEDIEGYPVRPRRNALAELALQLAQTSRAVKLGKAGATMKALLAAVLLLSPSLVLAADGPDAVPSAAQPTAPQPQMAPPAPPESPEPPPADQASLTQETSASGQWVYTGQYGWVWMPYGDSYTYQPTDGGAPNMYVYYPTVGWCWVVAPWIWGWGPQPYFGIYGTARYGWYGYGYGHWYGYRGAYANWYGRGYWTGGHWYGTGHGAVPYHPAGPGTGFNAAHSGYVTARGAYAAPRASYAAPRTAYAAPRGGYSAPRGGYTGMPSAAGHPSGSFGGHPTASFGGGHAGGFGGGHAGGGGGGHGGGGHR